MQDGSRRKATEVVGDRVWFLDSPRTDAEPPAGRGDDAAAAEAQPELLGESEESGEPH